MHVAIFIIILISIVLFFIFITQKKVYFQIDDTMKNKMYWFRPKGAAREQSVLNFILRRSPQQTNG